LFLTSRHASQYGHAGGQPCGGAADGTGAMTE